MLKGNKGEWSEVYTSLKSYPTNLYSGDGLEQSEKFILSYHQRAP